MTVLDPKVLPLAEALGSDEWHARRTELQNKVRDAAKMLLDFSQADGLVLPFDGFTVEIEREYEDDEDGSYCEDE